MKVWYKIVFSIAIIVSSIPSIISDFTEGYNNSLTHYGTLIVGLMYLIENLFWVIDLWEIEEEENFVIEGEFFDGDDRYEIE